MLGALDWKTTRFRPIVESQDLILGNRREEQFSIAPDGKSLITGVARSEYDIWMVEGFPSPLRLAPLLALGTLTVLCSCPTPVDFPRRKTWRHNFPARSEKPTRPDR
jgi:hypothetical protein